MTTSSKVVADSIKRAVLSVLQSADELGGPERPEYIEIMEELAAECSRRAETARETDPRREVLAWVREHINAFAEDTSTGGGCTAISIPVDGGGHWLITESGGACIPESLTERLAVGIYGKDGGAWVCFDVADMAAAAALIESYVSDAL